MSAFELTNEIGSLYDQRVLKPIDMQHQVNGFGFLKWTSGFIITNVM
jgi:hypothetical protein